MNLDSSRTHWLIVGISIVLMLLIYLQTGWHGYGFDDHLTTQLHPTVAKGISEIPELLSSNYIEVDGALADYRPIAQVTFALEQSIFGTKPWIGHVINLFLYGLVILVFCLVLRGLNLNKSGIMVPMAVLVFAIHPVHSEVVASLKNREEILALLFGLIAWLCFIRFSLSKNWGWACLAIPLLILGLMSKLSIAPLVVIIPYSVWYFHLSTRRALIQISLLSIVALTSYLILVSQFFPWEDRTYQFIEKPLAFVNDPITKWSQIITAIGYYFKLSIWPYPMSVYYGYDAIPTSTSVGILVSVLSVIGALTLSIFGIIRRSIFGFGVSVFLIALIPVSNILYPIAGTVIERGLFTPSMGIAIALGAVFQFLLTSKLKWVGLTVTTLLTIGYTTASTLRVNDWATIENLLEVDVNNHPNSAKLHQLLGTVYLDKAKRSTEEKGTELAQKAAFHFKTSLSINDDWSWLNKQLGLTYAKFLGKPDMAIPYFRREFQLKPKNYTASFNLAKCYAYTGQSDSSMYYTERTLSIKPGHFPSLRQISRSNLLYGDSTLGMQYLNKMVSIYPESDDPYLILADMNFLYGDTVQALENLETAIKVNPKNDNTLKILFDYYYSKGEAEKAEGYRDLASMN